MIPKDSKGLQGSIQNKSKRYIYRKDTEGAEEKFIRNRLKDT